MLETWSEFHEGTDICESREYGRQYINLTRKYTRLFKKGWKPPALQGKYTDAARADIVLGGQNRGDGLRLIEFEDGMTKPVVVQDSAAIKPASPDSRYIYFAADDSFKWSDSMHAKLEVEYFDAGTGKLSAEFDGSDPTAPFKGAYTPVGKAVRMRDTKQWKTAEFDLRGARFLNSENSQADFRLDVLDPDICVRRVALVRE
jgi:hypothetical protein